MTTYTPEQLAARDAQRQHIIDDVIHKGAWKGATTIRELAAEWGMASKYVRQLCDEAWGAVMAMARPDAEQKFEAAMAELEALKTAAWAAKAYVGKEAEEVDQPNLPIILNALRTQLQVYGKLERPGAGANRAAMRQDDDYERLSKAEKLAVLDAARRDLEQDGRNGALQ